MQLTRADLLREKLGNLQRYARDNLVLEQLGLGQHAYLYHLPLLPPVLGKAAGYIEAHLVPNRHELEASAWPADAGGRVRLEVERHRDIFDGRLQVEALGSVSLPAPVFHRLLLYAAFFADLFSKEPAR